MANWWHVRRLKRGVAGWNAWRKKNRDVLLDLRRADLSGVDLSGVDLSGVTLENADLSKANLNHANLGG
jgi:uncharacterized protein YjbI with pentapeptide repeats